MVIAGRAIGLGTSNLGESWSVVMTVIMQVIDKLTRRNAHWPCYAKGNLGF